MNNYTIRKTCIFCDHLLNDAYFEQDYTCCTAHYAVEASNANENGTIPYNILICPQCNTVQTKYLADLNILYKVNHADSTGSVMRSLHTINLDFILKHKHNIKNIIEIGSSKGLLADSILDAENLKYFIIEPSYIGNRDKKTIIEDFYENVNDSELNANTLIISHVFEHFYNPKQILEKISNNKNIENFFLVFPDLEFYVKNSVCHVLNVEHTYYITNEFLVNLLKAHGFGLVEKLNYDGHSVLFYFKREQTVSCPVNINFVNSLQNVDYFFEYLSKTVLYFNKAIQKHTGKNIYVWPSSAHTVRLFEFGLNQTNIKGLLDNSELKVGKQMFGLPISIFNFKYIIDNEKDSVLLLNGGPFNKEAIPILEERNIAYYLPQA